MSDVVIAATIILAECFQPDGNEKYLKNNTDSDATWYKSRQISNEKRGVQGGVFII